MILTDLWFSNFRKHTNLHIKLKPGVTGIVGDNGTGKSSIIEGIQFLLTGELFNGDTKAEAINLDADSGYVAGAFVLNGKKGRLERHLDSSTVRLKYDGVEYKKSTEVKELWDTLLQLNADIIKKVIIAQQGHIPQLFSGDPAVREKVFQRIFLVPPTEKIRSMIWKDYLKQAPPMIPEEDLLQLNNTKDRLEVDVTLLARELTNLNLLSTQEVETIRKRLDYIQKCRDADGKRLILQTAFKEAEQNVGDLQNKRKQLTEKLKIDIGKYEKMKVMLLQHKGIYTQKLKLEDQLNALKSTVTKDRYDELHMLMDDFGEKARIASEEAIKWQTLTDKWEEELEVLRALDGKAECPTCHQPLEDCTNHIQTTTTNLQAGYLRAEESYQQQRKWEDDRKHICDEMRVYSEFQKKRQEILNQLEQLKDITFDESTLQQTTAVLERYKELKAEEADNNVKYAQWEAKLANLDRELNELQTYDGEDVLQECADLLKTVGDNTENIRVHQQLSVDYKVKQAELKAIEGRIKNTEENQKKNKLRNNYVATLQKAYDVLHTSQFPRKLIMSYADIVTDHLQENLDLFDIPYKARVADNFKIEMVDDQDRVLPSVSGGQEIMVGISLHLALHDLFGQSFPMMIIDEGTTHLDSPNRKAYFEMIKGLKAKSKLKQILIIDHDPQLSEVVDYVVKLKKND